jgi:hypothetical protein
MSAFMDVVCNGQSLRELLAEPPKINDQLESICRTLELKIRKTADLENYMGQPVEYWYNGERWFIGFLMRREVSADGFLSCSAYDPLFFLKKHPDDYYFKNQTGKQIFGILAEKSGIRVKSLGNTGAAFPHLYYQGQDADKIAIDVIARINKATGKKFWFKYDPAYNNDGLVLFERVLPAEVWVFQVGVNLTSASKEENIEDLITTVKLVNRETGKTVIKQDQEATKQYGHRVLFEEVDKEHAKIMEKTAADKLKKLCKVTCRMSFSGVNPAAAMPQFFGADVIYVEEPITKIIGAYHIESVSHTFVSDSLINLDMEIREAPEAPEIQYEDATKTPDGKKSSSSGKGVQQNYGPEVNKAIQKYGL